MSRKTGRAIVASCALGAAMGLGLILYGVLRGGGAVAVQDAPAGAEEGIRDIGAFKVGFDRGLERAGFSGRHLVQVFVSETDTQVFESLVPVLADPSVTEAMAAFTGVIVPVPPEEVLTESERKARAEAEEAAIAEALETGQQLPPKKSQPRFDDASLPIVSIQSLQGPILSLIPGKDLTVEGLSAVLLSIAAQTPVVPGPLYERSRTALGVFDVLKEAGEHEALRIAAESLAEIEPGSPAHTAAEQAYASARQ